MKSLRKERDVFKMETFVTNFLLPFLAILTAFYVIIAVKVLWTKRILIADNEEGIRLNLRKFLKKNRYMVYTASTVDEAKGIIETEKLDYAIIDLKFEGSPKYGEYGGIEIFQFLKENQPKAKPIILSGYTFEETKASFKERCSERELEQIENDYVDKGGENYILAILNKVG